MATVYKKAWVLCLSGSRNALERVDAAIVANEPDAKVIQPLIEALWWICAADETLSVEYPSQWKVHLRPKLGVLPQLKGLRWIRNRITHQISQWEIARPPFMWEDAETIAPTGTVKPAHDHGRSEYIALLQGNDARDAIRSTVKGIQRSALGGLPP